MARPNKQGIDYFSFDTDFFQDIKVRKILRSCGASATSILINLLCRAYKDRGYYMRWDDDMTFLISDDVGVTEGAVKECVNKAIQVGFFDKDLFDKYSILTSSGIQKRFRSATLKRGKVEFDERFLIGENRVFDGKNSVNDTKNTEDCNTKNRQAKMQSESKNTVSESKNGVFDVKNSVIDSQSTQSKVKYKERTTNVVPKNTDYDESIMIDIGNTDFLFSDNNWVNAFCFNFNLSPESMIALYGEFCNNRRLDGKHTDTPVEIKKHFKNWLKFKQRNENNRRSGANGNRSADTKEAILRDMQDLECGLVADDGEAIPI